MNPQCLRPMAPAVAARDMLAMTTRHFGFVTNHYILNHSFAVCYQP